MRDTEQGTAQHVAMHRGNLAWIRCKLAQCEFQFGTKYCSANQSNHL